MSAPTDHVDHLLDDYLHQLLDPPDMFRVARHCDACAACKAALEAAGRRLVALRTVPAPLPETLVQTVLQRVAAVDRRQVRLRRRVFGLVAGGLAAAALLLGCFQWYYVMLAPTPFDLVVLGQRTLLAAAPASLRVRLTNRHATPAAVGGIPVTIELLDASAKRTELAHFDTDADGTGQPRFRLPEWADGDYRLRVTAATPGGPEVIEEAVKLHRSWKVMLSSDKPVYQPGQTIHLRAMTLRRPDLHPVAGEAATFTVNDPKGNVIFKHAQPTSKHGITSADCELATEIPEGSYTVACQVGDSPSRLGVEVKRYVLPKFKLDVQADKSFYKPGDTVRLTVQADYFFGKPVADAAVEVETEPLGPELRRMKRTARTDAKGNAAVSIVLPQRVDVDTRVTFHVSVADTAGQTQTRDLERLCTSQPLRVEVIPENDTLVGYVSNRIYVLTTYADGRPARTRVTVSHVPGELQTDEQGVASFEIMPPARMVTWRIFATDGRGATARCEKTLDWGQPWLSFLLRTDRAVYDGGATVKLTALGQGDEPVFVDVLKDGQTVLTETIDMEDGGGQLALDLPPELFGTLQLCAYRLAPNGDCQRKTRVLYVRPARQLSVSAALDRTEYRPGRRARVELRLTDAHGKPAPGALSLSAVDEAVFSVLTQAPGAEQANYTVEQGLLQSVYRLHNWEPGGSPAPQRDRLEEAIFSTTTKTAVGSITPLPDFETVWRQAPPGQGVLQPVSANALSANTFPAKKVETEKHQRQMLSLVATGFALWLAAFLAALYLGLWFVLLRKTMLWCHLFVIGFCGCFVGPGCSGESGRQTFKYVGSQVGRTSGAGADADPRASVTEEIAAVGSNKLPPADAAPVRVRELFPETLLWRPEVVTDDEGHASIDVDLADSITTWRLLASAVDADGRLGATQTPLKVFQPFFVDVNLPVTLTRGDEVTLPVVVSNYLDKPQTVTLTLDDAPWCERLGEAEKRLELAAGEVRSVGYVLRAKTAGSHALQVSARGSDMADAVRRNVEVVPDGRAVEEVVNGNLASPADMDLVVPEGVVPGSVKAVAKFYPSSFSQLVEGLDGIFRMPSGCFEQTSSTTYPNVLALDYLRRTQQTRPQVEARARQYIHLGYQRLLTFEIPGGGFDWFGHPPANRTLTAYGLMEFEDMARVHDVDPRLIERTRKWLLDQRRPDGSWQPESHLPHDAAAAVADAELRTLATTAYIAAAVFGNGHPQGREPTRNYLLIRRPETINDPHALALVAEALLALDAKNEARVYLDRLDVLERTSSDGKQIWWEQGAGRQTMFYGSGLGGNVETTALATLAFLHGQSHPETSRRALAWLVAQRNAAGTWPSTQATVLSLRALLAVTDGNTSDGSERRIEVRLGDRFRQEIVIPAGQSEVMRQIDLTPHLGQGPARLTLTEANNTPAGFQVAFRYNVPDKADPTKPGALGIDVAYDRTELSVGQTVRATAAVTNRTGADAAMVMLELPVPAGFAPVADDFEALVRAGTAAKYQVQARGVLVYLRNLAPDKPLSLTYRLTATTPAKVTAPPARVYEYYNPDRLGRSSEVQFTVKGG
jgi:uncharacterized protein YfaS (alpha-2-macroglobulin family)